MTNEEKFIAKANVKFGDKFDYSEFKYVNAKTKSVIKCPYHGPFEQNPDKHLNSKYGCIKCANKGRARTRSERILSGEIVINKPGIPLDEYKDRIFNKHGNKFTYDFSKYTTINKGVVVLVCSKHGSEEHSPSSLLISSYGCTRCANEVRSKSRTRPYSYVASQMTARHSGIYTYSKDNEKAYKNKRSKIVITCKKHGDFIKSAQKHLGGQGCDKCMFENLVKSGKLPGGYCETIFSRSDDLKNRLGVIYYIKVGNRYKIGITTNITNRIKSIRSLSKSVVEVIKTKDMYLYEAYLLEQEILEKNSIYRVSDSWSTELFSKDVLLCELD